MDLHQFKYFLALSKELHFWNTASKMHITQSALSRQIQSLENELGLQLFYRDKRNVKLTPAGKFLQEKWEIELNHLNSLHQLAKQIHLGESGAIRLAYPDSISSSVLPEFIKKIVHLYPKLKVELLQLTTENEEEYLKNYKVDIVFTRDLTSSPTINHKKLNHENLSFVVPDHHVFRSLEDITEQSLKKEKLILTTQDHNSSYNDIVKEIITSYNMQPDSSIQCEFGSTVISLIKNGLGISILPYSYSLHQYVGIRFIPLPFVTALYINWRNDDPNPILKNILNLI